MSLQDNLENGYSSLALAANQCGASDTGAAWLVKTLDPYHDAPVALRGLPDTCEAKTIVRELKASRTISFGGLALDSATSNGSWGVHIDLLPLGAPMDIDDCETNIGGGVRQKSSGQVNTLFPLTIAAHVGEGSPTGPTCYPLETFDGTFTFANVAGLTAGKFNKIYTGIDIDLANKEQQPFRILAAAFEVHNVTAPLYQTGVATAYRINSEFDLHEVSIPLYPLVAPSSTTNYMKRAKFLSLPLDRQEDMLRLPGTVQWEAKDGCYCVGALDPVEVDKFMTQPDVTSIVGINSQSNGVNACLPTGQIIAGNMTAASAFSPGQNVFISSLQTGGIYFTGLREETVLQINVRWVIETIPDVFDNDITLANVSAEYDPAILELYAKTVRLMPPGVPVNQNPLGEWFDSIMALVANTASFIGGAIAGAPGAVVGGGIGTAATWLGNLNKRSRGDMLRR